MNARLHRLLARILLALALVFAQQVGAAHAAVHAGKHGTDHEHRNGLKVQACDDCVSFAQVQGAGRAVLAKSAAIQGCLPPAPRAGTGRRACLLPAFRSRAPPLLCES